MLPSLPRLLTTASLFSLLLSAPAMATPTAFLPVGYDQQLEHQIDRLFAVTTGVPMSKPYRISVIETALAQAKDTHPALYQSINQQLNRYRGELTLSRVGATLRYDGDETMPLPNQRGLTSDTWGQVFAEGLWRPNQSMLVQGGMEYRPHSGELVPYNTFVALAGEDLQLTLGYKEHWFSPFRFSGQLFSTNAKASPSVSVGMVAPAHNWWNLDFELFYTQLNEVPDGIRFAGETFDGSPRVAGVHISVEPVEGWKLAVNRIMQFGGGPRNTSFSDVLKAFYDPAGNDNSYSDEERNSEAGDQIASVTSTFYIDGAMPAELYFEYAGEDTQGGSNYSLGNQSMSGGVFLPALTQRLSLRYEYNQWKTAWYTNGIYPAGNTNKGRVFGHWAADRREFADAIPAQIHTIAVDFQQNMDTYWQLKYANQYNESDDYVTGHELQILNSQPLYDYQLQTIITYGRNVFDETYGQASVSLLW